MRPLLPWLGLLAFVLGFAGVHLLPTGAQQSLCGVAATWGLAAAFGGYLDGAFARDPLDETTTHERH